MCFGLDLIQVSSSEEEAKSCGFPRELSRRLFGLLLAGSDSLSEEDPSIFVGGRTSSILAQCSRFQDPFGVPKLLEGP